MDIKIQYKNRKGVDYTFLYLWNGKKWIFLRWLKGAKTEQEIKNLYPNANTTF